VLTLLELNFGALGDLFGRKRLLVGGAVTVAAGEVIGVLTPGAVADTRVLVLWIGQIVAGIGAPAVFPTSLAMVAAGTHMRGRRRRVDEIPQGRGARLPVPCWAWDQACRGGPSHE
jgi:MFS family permease